MLTSNQAATPLSRLIKTMNSKATGKNNHPSHAKYKSEKRWEKNKVRNLKKIAKQQPNNKQVIGLLG